MCGAPGVELAAPDRSGRCAPGQRSVSLVPGPTTLCVVSVLGIVYLPPARGGCARPATSLTVPSTSANVYFCPGFLNLLTPVNTPNCLPGEPVYAVTKPPQAVNDAAGVSYGAPTATGSVLANDLYISLNPVTVTALTSSGTVTRTTTGFKTSLADGSTLTLSGAGAYNFTASAGFFTTCTANATDVFGYTITNAYGQASSASLTVTLTCPPPQSQAVNDDGSLTYDAAGAPTATGNLLANDKNLTTDASTITAVNSVTAVNGVITETGTYGTLVVQTTGPHAGNYTYTPSGLPATCATLTDTFDYTLTDGYGRSSSASLTVTLSCDQAAPIALPGTAALSSSSPPATGNVITDLVTVTNSDPVNVTSVSAGGGPAVAVSGLTTVDLTDGVLTISPDGAYSYTANSSFFTSCSSSALDSATYTVTDEFGQTAGEGLTFTLSCPPPLSITLTDDVGGTFSSATNDTTGGHAIPGSAVTYNVELDNISTEAQDVTVSDMLPADFTSDSWSVSLHGGASAALSGGTGSIYDAVSLPAAASIDFTIVGTVISSATGSISNTVTATDGPGSFSSTDTATLRPFESLAIANTDNLTDLSPGDPVTYTIVVSNTGPSDATSVSVVDTTGLTAVSSPNLPAAVTFNPATDTWSVGRLAAGAAVTLQLSGTVPSNAAGSFSSTATASATGATSVSSTATNSVVGS